MSLLKGKIAQRSAVGLSAAALVAAIALPTTVMGQSITLNRCPAGGTGGPSTTCVSQIAVPIAVQHATQSSTIDPTVTNTQSNDVDLSASNRNRASAVDINAQSQRASQEGGDQTNHQSNDQDVSAHATNTTEGGATVAIGPSAHVTFTLSQSSDASANGDASVTQTTGNSGGNANATGNIG